MEIKSQKNYERLYYLQDKVLNIFKDKNFEMYLTDGTALHRFHYQNYRYSEDLDFFSSKKDYENDFDTFLENLSNNRVAYKLEANNKTFRRLIVENELKIDLVVVLTPHFGELEIQNGILIDNKENILSNKLSAILSRTEYRDVYDIFILLKNNTFNKDRIIENVKEKTSDEIDAIFFMLEVFPIKKITQKDIDFMNLIAYNDFKSNYKNTIECFIKDTNKNLNNQSQKIHRRKR